MLGLMFLIGSFVALVGAFLLEGGHFAALFVGTAGMIVFGGTIGAVGLSFPKSELKRFPSAIKKAFSEPDDNPARRVFFFMDVASLARREGVLALEGFTKDVEHVEEMARVGLQLVTDAVEKDLIRDILETYIEQTEERHHSMIAMFEAAGGFAPTMGIIGTVMGLVHVLGNLSDPGSLGPAIAVAFIATLYGVASANVFWLPVGAKLKALNKIEAHGMNMILEGVMLVEQGANPKVVEEKLKAFCSPDERYHMESQGKS
ncbi:MAG: MotA/TolQ/ExbB proton channel family protein [Deltaproteobacteria bacterium]|nr:MotA/TolQ/ExbB proton channel family protein [Deltaproteobacteria bacterium]